MIERQLTSLLVDKLNTNKVIVLLGARQTGKSTLLKHIQSQLTEKSLFLDADDPMTRALLENQSTPNLLRLMGDYIYFFIDEAQRVKNIGLTVKQMHDANTGCHIIVSGSSALELSNAINEPLTGRKWEYQLFPLSFQELQQDKNWLNEVQLLDTRLIFGSYPDLVNHPGNEIEVLRNLTGSYLYKDIFSFQDIRKPQLLEKLMQLLALQMASEVSYHELAQQLEVNTRTVEHYIDLLEKTYVLFRLPSFSRNLRNELKKSRKIYFYDNGIRNSIISNFNPVNLRNDTGSLWENYLISERMKKNAYAKQYAQTYFWRTTQQQEIDYIEDYNGQLHAFEMKWGKKTALPSIVFTDAYPNSTFTSINKENYTDFIGN